MVCNKGRFKCAFELSDPALPQVVVRLALISALGWLLDHCADITDVINMNSTKRCDE